MTDNRESDRAPVDTCENIIRDFDQVFGACQSNDSQTAGLRDLHIESVSSGDSETPASHGNTPKRETSQKHNRNSDNKQASQTSPGATLYSGLQVSPSLSANLALLGSQHSTPILPSTPDGTRNDPVVVPDGGGSTSTELYSSGMSDMSKDDVYDNDNDNNNNGKSKDTTQTDDLTERAPEDNQNSSGSSGTLVSASPPGPLDPNTPGGLGGPSGSAAGISGIAADQLSSTAASGTAASGTAAQRHSRSAAQPLDTPSDNQEGVKGVSDYTTQPPPEKDSQQSESEMETDFSECDKQDIASSSNLTPGKSPKRTQ